MTASFMLMNTNAQTFIAPRPGQTVAGSEPVVTRAQLSGTDGWRDYPADPALGISGDPKARFNIFRSKGDATPVHRAMLISLEPSKFRYRFVGDESWLVLKGRVTITLEDGQVVEMKPNDPISIKGGRNSVWEVHESFLKFVVVSAAAQ